MKKQILIVPFIFFALILLVFFYLLIIERNPAELPSNLLNKNVPIFEANSLIKEKKFIGIIHGMILIQNIYGLKEILEIIQKKKHC